MSAPATPGMPVTNGAELSHQRLERTGARIVAGTWGCAVITMAASAANAALTYGALGDNRTLGVATGVAVDIGLCVALIGDRRLYAHGLSSTWGRALRITTALMSLVLNVGISLREGHYFAALLHSFLPVLLIVLCEYGQDVLLQFTALRERETAQRAQMAPVPIAEPLPQPHRPLSAPVPAAPVPSVRPVPDSHERQAPAWAATRTVTWSPSSTATDTSAPPSAPSNGTTLNTKIGSSPSIAAPGGHTSGRAPRKPGEDDLITRVRQLIAESEGHTPGRRTVAKRLGVTEHQARVAIDAVLASTGASLNGSGGAIASRITGGGAR